MRDESVRLPVPGLLDPTIRRFSSMIRILWLAVSALALTGLCLAQSPAPSPGSKRSIDDITRELQRRYNALTTAKASANPSAVTAASKEVSAFALLQLADLKMLDGAYSQATECYKKSLELEDLPETRQRLIAAALRGNQADQAIEQTQRILSAHPNDAQVLFLQGKAYMLKDDFQSAIKPLQRSLQLSRNVNAEYALAFSFLKLGNKPDAQKVFRQMLSEYGDRAIWHVVFGGAYRDSKLPDDAIREFRQAIALDPKVGHSYFFLGLTLLEENHWAQTDESMAALRQAVQQDPNDYFANFYLGAGESELKMFDDSNKHLLVAASSQPDSPEIWLYLGLNAFQQSNYKDSKTYLSKAVDLTGSDEARNNFQIRRAYIALGRIEFSSGNEEEAKKYIQRAKDLQNKSLANSAESISETMASGGMGQHATPLPYMKVPSQSAAAAIESSGEASEPATMAKLSPEEKQQVAAFEKQLRQVLSQSYSDWGTSEARQGQFQESLRHFHEAEQWDNSIPGLMRNTGIAALKVGDIQEALRALQLAVQIDPNDKAARARLALTLFRTDQYLQADEQFEVLASDALSDPSLAYAWGYTLVKLNQPQKASDVLGKATVIATSAEMLVSIGDLYSVLEDYEHAIPAYQKAVDMNPQIPKARFKMGAALIRLDRPQQAVAPLEAEIKYSPDDADVKYNLAYALLQVSQKERAMAMLRSIVTEHPGHPQAQYQLGKTLLEEGQVHEAVQHLEIAVKLDPASDYVHYQLQTAYRRDGQKEAADRELAVYRDMKTRKREKTVLPMPTRAQ